jgi:hypothetical protein
MLALCHEWKNVYKNLELYLISISGFGDNFTIEELLNCYTKIESQILSRLLDDDFMQDIFSAPQTTNEHKIKELIKALFKVGLLGKKAKDGSIHFSTTSRPDLIDIELTNESIWVIHPLFRSDCS